jgi:hypothetical protein
MRKVLIVLAMTVLAGLIYGRENPYAPTDEKLKTFYSETNANYFNNELIKNPTITTTNLNDAMGHTDIYESGKVHIYIDKFSNPIEKQAEMTLAHEMCHLKSGSSFDESAEFQGCMVYLAKLGAFKGIW